LNHASSPFVFVLFFHAFDWFGLDYNPSTSAYQVAGISGMYHYNQLVSDTGFQISLELLSSYFLLQLSDVLMWAFIAIKFPFKIDFALSQRFW
jgi:hypothetical protein